MMHNLPQNLAALEWNWLGLWSEWWLGITLRPIPPQKVIWLLFCQSHSLWSQWRLSLTTRIVHYRLGQKEVDCTWEYDDSVLSWCPTPSEFCRRSHSPPWHHPPASSPHAMWQTESVSKPNYVHISINICYNYQNLKYYELVIMQQKQVTCHNQTRPHATRNKNVC